MSMQASIDPPPAPVPDSSATLATLQAQLGALNALSDRVTAARSASGALLRLPTSGGVPDAALDSLALGLPGVFGAAPGAASARAYFDQLKALKGALLASEAQGALKAAAASLKADPKGIALGSRPKRELSPSAESPQPYQPSQEGPVEVFPILRDGDSTLSADRLLAFISDFNNTSRTPAASLALWRSVRPARPPTALPENPILRLSIQNVLVAYLTLDHDPDAPALVVESVNCFSPREMKSPHARSDWTVFLALSQHLARVLSEHPDVSVQQLLDMLMSYENLFTASCARCGRLLSVEGQVPSVVRRWLPAAANAPTLADEAVKEEHATSAVDQADADAPAGQWEPRHVGCARD